jgi:acetylornithine/succinyldiaminopimelate/putrescine aminotransferase
VAGGFPFGSMLVREKLAAALPPGTHASTFGGNALGCAAALATLAIFDEERILDNVQQRGRELSQLCQQVVSSTPRVAVGTRGLGLLQGIVIAAGIDPAAVLGAVRAQGVLATLAGGNVLRICPALNITAAELAEGMQGVARAFAQVAQEQAP